MGGKWREYMTPPPSPTPPPLPPQEAQHARYAPPPPARGSTSVTAAAGVQRGKAPVRIPHRDLRRRSGDRDGHSHSRN